MNRFQYFIYLVIIFKTQELRKVCHKFEIEKNYFEEEIDSLRKKIIVLEASLSDFDSFKLEFERVTFINS